MAKREFAIYERPISSFEDGRWVTAFEQHEVRVLARAEGYAMVRYPRCGPFVVSEKHLGSKGAE